MRLRRCCFEMSSADFGSPDAKNENRAFTRFTSSAGELVLGSLAIHPFPEGSIPSRSTLLPREGQ